MSEFEGRMLEVFWDGFDRSIREELEWFWKDQRTLTDVTVCCENGSVRAHKLVLALSSSYFHNMCVHSPSACSNFVISLPDVKLEDFKLILEYMYRGKVFINEVAAQRLVKLARVLHVKGFGSQNRPMKQRERSNSDSSQYADSDENEDTKVRRPKVHIRPEEIALDNVPPNRVTRATASNQAPSSAPNARNPRSQTPNSRRVSGTPQQTVRGRKLTEAAGHSGEKAAAGEPARVEPPEVESPGEAGPSGVKLANGPSSSKAAGLDKPKLRNAKGSEKKEHAPTGIMDKAGSSGNRLSAFRESNESPENQDPSGSSLRKSAIKRQPTSSAAKSLSKSEALRTTSSPDLKSASPNISAALSNLASNVNETHRGGCSASGRYPYVMSASGCDFTATSAAEISTHKLKEHSIVNANGGEPAKDTAKEEQVHICDVCGFSSKNPGALGSHRNRHRLGIGGLSSKRDLPASLRGYLEHFKAIYDCPSCFNTSFKTLSVMNRHFAKTHSYENLKHRTRITCTHCNHSYSQSDGIGEYREHLESHFIQADLGGPDQPAIGSAGKNPALGSATLNGINDGDPSKPGPSGASHMDVPSTSDQLAETASNADTERASSRGSFAPSLSEVSGKVQLTLVSDGKRGRLSNDDEATVEADLTVVKKEHRLSSAPSGGVFHKCADCNYETSQSHFLKRHTMACHSNGINEDPFLCRFCNFATAHRSTIKSHLVMVHRDLNTKISECYRNSQKIREYFEKNGSGQKKEVKTSAPRKRTIRSVGLTLSEPEASATSPKKKKSVIPVAATKNSRPSQRFGAALKLKKVALANQRNLSPQSTSNSDSRAVGVNLTRVSPRRSSSRRLVSRTPSSERSLTSNNRHNLKCPDCTYEAKSEQMFQKHSSLHQHVGETKLALCEICGVVKLKSSMFYHLKQHQVDIPKTTAPPSQ